MKSIIYLKKKDFEKNAVGRYLWNFISTSTTFKDNKKIIIETKHRWKNQSPIWSAFNLVLHSLRNEGVSTIIIK